MDPGLSHCPWTCLCILIFPLTKLACWGLFRGEECTPNPNLSTGVPCNAQIKSGQSRAGRRHTHTGGEATGVSVGDPCAAIPQTWQAARRPPHWGSALGVAFAP